MLAFVGSLLLPLACVAAISSTTYDAPSTTTKVRAVIAEYTAVVVGSADVQKIGIRSMARGQSRSPFVAREFGGHHT
jgi:hypothetical protein